LKTPEEFPAHPAAEMFPMMGDEELQALAEDIKANGLRELIAVYRARLLDGRNRLAACKLAGVEPQYGWLDRDKTDPVHYVLSRNLHRRHLTAEHNRDVIARVLKL